TRKFEVAGKTVTLVDLKSEDAGEAKAPPAEPERPTYTAPKGWEKSSRKVPFSIAVYEARDGDRHADVTITPLSGPAGGLLPNINRWRQQHGLKPADEEDVKKDARKIEVA